MNAKGAFMALMPPNMPQKTSAYDKSKSYWLLDIDQILSLRVHHLTCVPFPGHHQPTDIIKGMNAYDAFIWLLIDIIWYGIRRKKDSYDK